MSTAQNYLSSQKYEENIQPTDIPTLFSDKPDDPILNYDRLQLDAGRRQIDELGYTIGKGLVPAHRIERIKAFWLERFSQVKPEVRVTWSPYMGQLNSIGFTNDKFQHHFRAVDLLWNEPWHPETRNVCLRVHALRNLFLGDNPYYGLRFIDARYGIFVSANYYPGGAGHMGLHNDGVSSGKPLLHALTTITFKGRDYKDGGLHLIDRKGQDIDVESRIEPGDVIFYDGSLNHVVKPIIPFEGKTTGRLQIFCPPTVFKNLENDRFLLARIPMARLVDAKFLWLKDKIRVLMGKQAALR